MSDQQTLEHIPELDGLRGLAIFLVVMGHYFSFRIGASGVDLFFVLSGFLIGGILLDVRESPSYFRTFYTRRFFRIIPVYYAWIVGYILLAGAAAFLHVAPLLIDKVDFKILANFLFLQTFQSRHSGVVTDAWFAATWSLAVEEQFYLLAPLVIRFLSKRTLPILLGAIILAGPILRAGAALIFHLDFWLINIAMPLRADVFAWGMLLAVLWRNTRLRHRLAAGRGYLYGLLGVLFVGVLAIWKWFIASDPLVTETIGYSWIALFYATLLLLLLLEAGRPIAGIARMRWIRELGKVSYCVYLIHLTVYLFCRIALRHLIPSHEVWQDSLAAPFAVFLTYAIAKLSFISFEYPLLRRGHTFKYLKSATEQLVSSRQPIPTATRLHDTR